MFYLVEITDVNGDVAKAIWDKPNLDSAVMALHQTMASAMANANARSCLCIVINDKGATLRFDFWEREE